MAQVLFIDFETRSDVDLPKCGVEVYAESPNTRALCIAWAFDREKPWGAFISQINDSNNAGQFEWLGVFEHVRNGGLVVAHNAPFELAIWRMLHRRHPDIWPELKPEQLVCTMAQCRALSLPGALEQAAKALRLPVEKDMEGHALMRKMCKPRKPRKHEPQDVLLWHETPEQMARLLAYCKSDIEPERAIYYMLPALSPRERAYYLIDRRINDRGLQIDVAGVRVAAAAAAREQERLDAELWRITEGVVPKATNAAKLQEWVLSQTGSAFATPLLPDARRVTLEKVLARDDLRAFSPAVHRAIEIRYEAAKSSTKKLTAMLRGVCADGRARGLLEYHGTSTGRPAGRRIQPTNMPRTPEEFDADDLEHLLMWLETSEGDALVSYQCGSVLDAVSWSLRSLITARPGGRLLAVDYSNIEGRVLAWLAGENGKLQAFRDFDAGTGPDIYKRAYATSFGVPVETVTKEQRQNIGKVQELALGYQGGHGAVLNLLQAGGKQYRWMGERRGVAADRAKITAAVKAAVSTERWESALQLYWRGAYETAEEILAQRRLEQQLAEDEETEGADALSLAAECARENRHGLEPEEWAAIRIIVDRWREANPAIVRFWSALEAAALEAVQHPGTVTSAGRIQYAKSGDFLLCKLPSGRKIAYPYARVAWDVRKYRRSDGSEYEKKFPKLVFEGVDNTRRQWRTQYAYGGLLAENATQAVARCIQADSHHRLEAAGYEIVLHVYDENVCDMPTGKGSLKEMQAIMLASEPWAAGIPLACSGWEGFRFRK